MLLQLQGKDIVKEVESKHVQAFMKWCILGAKKFFDDGIVNFVPPCVARETRNDVRDMVEELDDFMRKHLKASHADTFISVDELKEVFLTYVDHDTSVSPSLKKELFGRMKLRLAPSVEDRRGMVDAYTILMGIKHDRRDYPTRTGKLYVTGYRGLAWKPGKVAPVVNAIYEQYVYDGNTRRFDPLSEEEEDENAAQPQ